MNNIRQIVVKKKKRRIKKIEISVFHFHNKNKYKTTQYYETTYYNIRALENRNLRVKVFCK